MKFLEYFLDHAATADLHPREISVLTVFNYSFISFIDYARTVSNNVPLTQLYASYILSNSKFCGFVIHNNVKFWYFCINLVILMFRKFKNDVLAEILEIV